MMGQVSREELLPTGDKRSDQQSLRPTEVSAINFRQDTTPLNMHDEDLTKEILKKMEDFECVAGHESIGYYDINDLCDNPEDDPSIKRLRENDQAVEGLLQMKDV